MQQTSVTQKMRTIAGVIYGLLFLYNVCAMYYVLTAASVTSVPVAALAELGLTLVAGAACVFCIGGRRALADAATRGCVAFTALAVLFELVTFKAQLDFIGYAMWTVFPSTAPTDGVATASALQYVLFAVRLVLMILAAFFVTSAKEGTAYAGEMPAGEQGEAGVAVVTEEVVAFTAPESAEKEEKTEENAAAAVSVEEKAEEAQDAAAKETADGEEK